MHFLQILKNFFDTHPVRNKKEKKKYMKLPMTKTFATMLSLLLMLTIAATFITAPTANAHDPPWTIPTYAYVACSPSTVGVGEYTLIVMWLDKYPTTAGGLGGDLWRGFTLDITKPDGTTQTIPYTGLTSQVGSAFITYTPDKVGDYSIVFSWPGQVLTNGTGVPNSVGFPYVGDLFEASTSDPFILHVQQEPIAEWVEPPLPSDYWTRPISTANRGWAQLTSNWLKGSWNRYTNFNEFGVAPNSPHVIWAKEDIHGGIADERYGAVKYDTTDYEQFWARDDPIIMSGKIYYNSGTHPNYGYTCVDLRTGEIEWHKNGTDNGLNNPYYLTHGGGGGATGPNLAQFFPELEFGQLFHYYSLNGEGVKDYLWMTHGSTWYMLDSNTGNWILTLVNVPGGESVTDELGDLLRYSYRSSTGQYLCWNSSQSIPPPSPTGTAQAQWEPRVGATIDAVNDTSWTEYGPNPDAGGRTGWTESDILPRSGYTMNVTGSTGLPSIEAVLQDENYVPKLIVHSYLSANLRYGSSAQTFEIAVVSIDDHVAPYSPYPDKTPTQNNNLGFGVTTKWDKTFTYPLGGNKTWQLGPMSYEDMVFTLWCKETRQWWGYSLEDGSQLWGPTNSQPEWDMYGNGGLYAYGKLFSGYFGGICYAYDMKTGENVWNYTASGIGYESPYGNFDVGYGRKEAADGKIFLTSFEHSPTQPLWRGSYLRAINATDGTEIWKILMYAAGYGVADGYVVAGSEYDNRIYAIGKGPSATTVSASPKVSMNGDSVLIEGTVTDESPGAKEEAQKRGIIIPAVADSDMEAYMEYLYEQQIYPSDAKGVEVTLDAYDPNGNFVHIDTVTSDLSGTYSAMYTPEVPGKYTIIATFAGSESYFSSYAETAIGVSEAPTQTPTPPPASSVADQYIVPGIIGIIVAIIVVGVLIILMLRKR
jgi:outer membrane protein assembly factor BamB